jgi:hypothetical protein
MEHRSDAVNSGGRELHGYSGARTSPSAQGRCPIGRLVSGTRKMNYNKDWIRLKFYYFY